MPHRIAIIGLGKIAADQHIPVISADPDFTLAAIVSGRGATHGDTPGFRSAAELYRALPEVDAVAVCTPPGPRYALVRQALEAGKDVLMEKPPVPTVSEMADLRAFAKAKGRILFQTWHSQYNAAVDEMRRVLTAEGVRRLRIEWREDVEKWHPGQEWVWAPGGFGVFDPGINALSILARVIPFPITVERALMGFQPGRHTPIEAEILFKSNEPHKPSVSGGFSWLEKGADSWTITVETEAGRTVELRNGGSTLALDGTVTVDEPPREYQRIYRRFAELLAGRRSEVDETPLRWVVDAFTLAERSAA